MTHRGKLLTALAFCVHVVRYFLLFYFRQYSFSRFIWKRRLLTCDTWSSLAVGGAPLTSVRPSESGRPRARYSLQLVQPLVHPLRLRRVLVPALSFRGVVYTFSCYDSKVTHIGANLVTFFGPFSSPHRISHILVSVICSKFGCYSLVFSLCDCQWWEKLNWS